MSTQRWRSSYPALVAAARLWYLAVEARICAICFASPEAALEALTEYLPTLIISDISMPGMTGFEFIRRLRERPPAKGGRIPAIAVTAFYEDFVAGAARNAGFDAYLTKPINFESLCSLVDHVVGLKRHRDSTAA